MRSGHVFVAALWAVGLGGGLLQAWAPAALPLPAPHFTLPLIVALLLDLLIMNAPGRARLEPVTMNERGLGVLGAATISFVTTMLLGAPQA